MQAADIVLINQLLALYGHIVARWQFTAGGQPEDVRRRTW